MNALQTVQALLLALRDCEQAGLNTMNLLVMRQNAKAEGRDHLTVEEVNGLLAESQAAIDDLNKSLDEVP